jgi:VWFA-related protein
MLRSLLTYGSFIALAISASAQTTGSTSRTVRVAVLDHNGSFIGRLDSKRFDIREGKNPIKLVSVVEHPVDDPVAIGIVLDTSGSMKDIWMPASIALHKKILEAWLAKFPPGSQYFVIGAVGKPAILLDWTTDPKLISQAFPDQPLGTTALYDAMATAIAKIETQPGSKSLLVFSDGQDNNSSISLDRILQILGLSDVMVHALFPGENQAQLSTSLTSPFTEEKSRNYFYSQTGQITGGAYLRFRTVGEFSDRLSQLSLRMQHFYVMRLEAPTTTKSGWHELKIKVDYNDPKLRVVAQQRFWVPKKR